MEANHHDCKEEIHVMLLLAQPPWHGALVMEGGHAHSRRCHVDVVSNDSRTCCSRVLQTTSCDIHDEDL